MDQKSQARRQIIRLVVSLAGVLLALHLVQSSDVLSVLTRPSTVGLLRLFGVNATQADDSLRVAGMTIPWNRDCAGLNVLGILWAMTIWTNRAEPQAVRYLVRLLLAVPAAFAANVARILTLIAYRSLLYPAVESPQLHYFIGFLWLVPVVGFFCRRGGRSIGRYTLETLHLAAVLSSLAPLAFGPGGSLVALSTLLLLAHNQFKPDHLAHPNWTLAAWLAAAVLIAASRMESLWLPWLIACPAFSSLRTAASWTGVVLLAGTIPLFAMHSAGQWVVLGAIGRTLWILGRTRTAPLDDACVDGVKRSRLARDLEVEMPAPLEHWPAGWMRRQLALVRPGTVAGALLLPFAVSPLNALTARPGTPPSAAMPHAVGAQAYRVRLVGQPPDLDLVWYESTGEGRHHTLDVCLQYRGVKLKTTTVTGVKTDGQRWMREFFVQRGELVQTYRDYLGRTFLPLSPAGVHLIASSPVEAMSAESFAENSGLLAGVLCRMTGPIPPPHPRGGLDN